MSAEKRERIRTLNDQLRRSHVGGRILLTQGVMAMGPENTVAVLLAIKLANDFNEAIVRVRRELAELAGWIITRLDTK